jgi:hypothetical protein
MRYHFDLGDSTSGPIGFCATVTAPDSDTAVAILRDRLLMLSGENCDIDLLDNGIDYIAVYLGPLNITAKDIDSIED